ncbi:hypothetical protein BSKO_01229 [Bryopsis sp. KO-2023]|nr:hypothetical protein BSKO_01229 [Bryopsis sp. KO-2023]
MINRPTQTSQSDFDSIGTSPARRSETAGSENSALGLKRFQSPARNQACGDSAELQLASPVKPFSEVEKVVRVASKGKIPTYIAYATNLLEREGETAVVLRGLGNAIGKTVCLAEILKQRIPGLYQITNVASLKCKAGKRKEFFLPMISIMLTTEKPGSAKRVQGKTTHE